MGRHSVPMYNALDRLQRSLWQGPSDRRALGHRQAIGFDRICCCFLPAFEGWQAYLRELAFPSVVL
jgi:hypothetical protein